MITQINGLSAGSDGKTLIPMVPYGGSIVPNSVSSGTSGETVWTATQVGTYTNFGNVVVSGNSFATISRTSGGTFSISQTPLDLSTYVATSDLNLNIGTNKFNKIDNTLGGHTYQNQGINNSGVIGTNSGWVGAKIPVSASTQYSFKHNDGIYAPSGVGVLAYLNVTGGTISTVDMSTLTNAGGLGGKTLTTPVNTGFIYKNVKVTAGGTKDYIDTFQLELGSATTTYRSYETQIDRVKNLKLIDIDARSLISGNTSNITTLTTNLVTTNNKFDHIENWSFSGVANVTNPTLIQLAFTIDTDGIVFSTGNTYNLNFTITSTDTNINSVVKMRTFQNDNSSALQIAGTSTNQQTIGSFSVPSSTINFDRTIQGSQRYLHIYLELTLNVPTQLTSFRYDGIKFTLNGVTKTPLNWAVYQPNFGEVINYVAFLPTNVVTFEDLPSASGNTSNYLYGKVMATIGDSMVKGHNLPANQVWDSLIATRNGMINFNYGINGTQMTNDNGFGGSVLSRYSGMTNDADYIGVFAGTNDAVGVITVGTDTDSYSGGQLTFKGALNDLCTGLINKYPNKKVYFITPYNRTAGTQQYITAIITICKKYSIPVFDNWTNGGVSWSNTIQTDSITLGDTYHLNAVGMEYASTKYEAFLRSL